MSNRLSFSSVDTYLSCSEKYRLSYLEKLRPTVTSSALLFGTAFDKAIEAVLKDRSVDEKEVFLKHWTEQKINNVSTKLENSLNIKYSANDYDVDILDKKDIDYLIEKGNELQVTIDPFDWHTCLEWIKNKPNKDDEDKVKQWYNIVGWICLYRKGLLFLDAHREQVLPRYKSIVNTQTAIEIKNQNTNDILTGYPDLIAVWEDDRVIVFDYKTSSGPYLEESVKASAQLTLYTYATDIPNAGFIVFNKKIIKIRTCEVCNTGHADKRIRNCSNVTNGVRCSGNLGVLYPKVEVQILIDTIPETTLDKVFEGLEQANEGIHKKEYVKNFESCYNFGKCPYFELCHKGKSEGLIKV